MQSPYPQGTKTVKIEEMVLHYKEKSNGELEMIDTDEYLLYLAACIKKLNPD